MTLHKPFLYADRRTMEMRDGKELKKQKVVWKHVRKYPGVKTKSHGKLNEDIW